MATIGPTSEPEWRFGIEIGRISLLVRIAKDPD